MIDFKCFIRSNFYPIFCVGFLFFLLGCQTPETQVYTRSSVPYAINLKKISEPLEIKEHTVILDARKYFDYSMAHLEGSYHLDWQDFCDSSQRLLCRFKKDLFTEARRLARMGIGPHSEVIVVGYGTKGLGEEGRLAWTLFYLGVSKVQFVSMDYFRGRITHEQSHPLKSVPVWKPDLVHQVRVTKKQLLNYIKNLAQFKDIVLLDVRTENEYLGRSSKGYRYPNLGAMNVKWTEFLTDQGRPNPEILPHLKAIGVTPQKRIVTLSDHGLRSSVVTMALLQMGYLSAATFPEGLLSIAGELDF